MNWKCLWMVPLAVLALAGCETTGGSSRTFGNGAARANMLAAITAEPPGDYFIGRRYYKSDYKFWGYIRKPRQPWSEARLVMLNENRVLAPDRARWDFGSDNGHEYRLLGYFSGDTVYEPASNGFYPEFVLTGIELISTGPGPIFRNADALNPSRRIIAQPL